MFEHEYIVTQPVFYLFIAFSALLTYGFFWGKRVNHRLFLSAFNDLADVIKPVDQTFTNIGGLIGYHANFITKKKGAITKVEATITFLPRQSWLYFPVSKLIRRWDRLFITLYLRQAPPEEGHLIEVKYAAFRGPKITNADRLNREKVRWGKQDFYLYYQGMKMRDALTKFIEQNSDPGIVRHIAVVPDQQRCFVFMIPRKGEVGRYFAPVYQWVPSLIPKAGEA